MLKVDRDRLDYEMGRRGLDQRTLAQLCGVHETHLSRLRSGRTGIKPKTARRIAEALARVPVQPGAELLARPEASS